MVLLPVVERELRVAARGRAMYRVRFWAALIILGILAWSVGNSSINRGNPSQLGRELLGVLTVWAFGFAGLIGVVATSDCVSHEKREGTLGLLFLTDLKGYDVICGKLVANSVNAFYALVAMLPIMGIPLLVGGVTATQFSKLAMVLITTMVLSLSVGIFVSTICRNERIAAFFTLLAMLLLTFLPVILMVAWFPGGATFPWGGLMFSPGYGALQVMIQMFGALALPEWSYWFSIAWQWILAALLIIIASNIVPHSWDDSGKVKKAAKTPAESVVIPKPRPRTNRKLLEKNPFVWLALRGEASPRRVWMFVASIIGLWAIGRIQFGDVLADDGPTLTFLMILIHGPLKIWIAAESCRRFVEDRNNNTYEFLLSTPLTEKNMIDGQWVALLRQFAGPVAVVLIWEGFILAHLRVYANPWPEQTRAFNAAGMVCLVTHSVALSWVGMWLGCVLKSRTRAIFGSLILVVGIPWLICLVTSAGQEAAALITGFYGFVVMTISLVTVRPFLITHLRRLAAG